MDLTGLWGLVLQRRFGKWIPANLPSSARLNVWGAGMTRREGCGRVARLAPYVTMRREYVTAKGRRGNPPPSVIPAPQTLAVPRREVCRNPWRSLAAGRRGARVEMMSLGVFYRRSTDGRPDADEPPGPCGRKFLQTPGRPVGKTVFRGVKSSRRADPDIAIGRRRIIIMPGTADGIRPFAVVGMRYCRPRGRDVRTRPQGRALQCKSASICWPGCWPCA